MLSANHAQNENLSRAWFMPRFSRALHSLHVVSCVYRAAAHARFPALTPVSDWLSVTANTFVICNSAGEGGGGGGIARHSVYQLKLRKK